MRDILLIVAADKQSKATDKSIKKKFKKHLDAVIIA
jgi:hypothetical protein